MKKTAKEKLRIWNIAGMASGVLMIVFGIALYTLKPERKIPDYAAFGGDAYTEIHAAARAAAMNVAFLSDFLCYAFVFLMIGIGAAVICFFGSRIAEAEITGGQEDSLPEL